MCYALSADLLCTEKTCILKDDFQGRNEVQIFWGAEFYKWLKMAPKTTHQKDLVVFRAFLRGPRKILGGPGQAPSGPPTCYALVALRRCKKMFRGQTTSKSLVLGGAGGWCQNNLNDT